jgi:hypothetical protein
MKTPARGAGLLRVAVTLGGRDRSSTVRPVVGSALRNPVLTATPKRSSIEADSVFLLAM